MSRICICPDGIGPVTVYFAVRQGRKPIRLWNRAERRAAKRCGYKIISQDVHTGPCQRAMVARVRAANPTLENI